MKITKLIQTLVGSCCLVGLLTGCASLYCGSNQAVSIDTLPSGAEVLIYDANGEVIFKHATPCVADLKRRAPSTMEGARYVVLVRKDGYAPQQFPLTGLVNRAYCCNIVNVVGFVVDPVVGGMWTLTPEDINTKLESQNAAFFGNKKGVLICLKEQVPQDLLPYLKPVKD
jgi:hypothetical protein